MPPGSSGGASTVKLPESSPTETVCVPSSPETPVNSTVSLAPPSSVTVSSPTLEPSTSNSTVWLPGSSPTLSTVTDTVTVPPVSTVVGETVRFDCVNSAGAGGDSMVILIRYPFPPAPKDHVNPARMYPPSDVACTWYILSRELPP